MDDALEDEELSLLLLCETSPLCLGQGYANLRGGSELSVLILIIMILAPWRRMLIQLANGPGALQQGPRSDVMHRDSPRPRPRRGDTHT